MMNMMMMLTRRSLKNYLIRMMRMRKPLKIKKAKKKQRTKKRMTTLMKSKC